MEFEYDFLSLLNKEITSFLSTDNYSDILLCVYSVDTSSKYPFLKYLLTNTGFNTLTLPRIPIYNSLTKENLITYSKVIISGLLQINNFDELNNKIEFNGFYEYDDKLYLFYDLTNFELEINETYLNSRLRFALIDEITNTMNICNILIDYETTKFFINNDMCNYLQDKNGKNYEIPIVGYIGKSTKQKLNFTLTFGETAKDKTSILGPYYYFTSFNNAIQNCNKNKEGGIIRFALFLGKTKYIENFPNDEIDESLIKSERLDDETLDQKYERLTLRISDHDGLWTHTYNSVYLGKLELDDGSYIKDAPLIVLREYNQQIPLTCHYIINSNLV